MEAAEQLISEALRAVNDSVSECRKQIAALEDYIADIDHAKAERRAVEQLHSRVDDLATQISTTASVLGEQVT